jgi:hypothetical protein
MLARDLGLAAAADLCFWSLHANRPPEFGARLHVVADPTVRTLELVQAASTSSDVLSHPLLSMARSDGTP